MVYNELPVLEEVVADGPFLNQCITECQLHSTEFYECLTTTENTIRDSVLTGKEYNKYVKNLSVALEDAADILPDHATALEKFSTGLSRIETYREMLITQTEVLTLEPLVDIRKQMEEIKELSEGISKGDELVSMETERYCGVRPIAQDDQHTLVTYPKSCIDTLRLKEEHALNKLEYVYKLRKSSRQNQLKYVQKMLEQMLAQFSYANFAYVVMSEMEPYLSELFVELQAQQKEAAVQDDKDQEVLDRTRREISESCDQQIIVMKDTYPGADTEVKNSAFKSLLSFAVPGNKGGKFDYLTGKRNSFLSYLNNNDSMQGSQKQPETLTSQEEEEENTTDDVKSTRVNPFRDSPPDLGDDLPILDSSFMAAATEAPLNTEPLDPDNSSTLCQDMSAVSERTGDVSPEEGEALSPEEEARENAGEDENRSQDKPARKNKRRNKLTKVDSLTKLRNQNKTSGYLYVRQKSALGHKWILMYCVIERDWLKCLVSDNELLELEHLPTTTVKPVGLEVERNSCFYLVSPKGKRCYQALTELDRRKWMQSLTQSSINVLQHASSISQGDHVARMHSIPGNSRCADCAAPDPEWACIDHGTTICIDCSGVHRSMGVNVSKVRSLLLDNWTEDIISQMVEKGNTKFNEVYECNVSEKIVPDSTREERSVFMRKKYILKAYYRDNPSEDT
ncbi:uncharacterized protein LOC134817954 isoform X2 [Bolinopsis microptera]|uniref:uncharacterized protein LOC134817954 isoform X2 n=1 Tax=Bolinopsis microptera TaxID=2820187 RepID=UPI00307A0F89